MIQSQKVPDSYSAFSSLCRKYEALPGKAGSQNLQNFLQRLTAMCEIEQKSSYIFFKFPAVLLSISKCKPKPVLIILIPFIVMA